MTGNTRIKPDAALGIALAVFFGFGLLLLTYIQRLPNAGKAGLDKFLFGQAATLLGRDLVTMARWAGPRWCWSCSSGRNSSCSPSTRTSAPASAIPSRGLEILLITLMVVAIVVGIQTVGVVLMSAMLVAPAAAARQWTEKLNVMVPLAGVFGAVVGLLGAITSSLVPRLPTGPGDRRLHEHGRAHSRCSSRPGGVCLPAAGMRRRQKWQFAQEALAVHLLQHEARPRPARRVLPSSLRSRMPARTCSGRRPLPRASWDAPQDADLLTRTDGQLTLTEKGREWRAGRWSGRREGHLPSGGGDMVQAQIEIVLIAAVVAASCALVGSFLVLRRMASDVRCDQPFHPVRHRADVLRRREHDVAAR